MTHTTVVTRIGNAGSENFKEATVTISSYTTGGEDLSDLTGQFGSVGVPLAMNGGGAAYFFTWIPATNKLKMWTATGTEVGSTVNVGIVYIKMFGV
jgi:hypothetical protein